MYSSAGVHENGKRYQPTWFVNFLFAQIAFVVLYTTDNIIVSKYFGAAQVTPFSLVDKVFNIGYSVFAVFFNSVLVKNNGSN